jgi:hypothetical protein
VRRLTVYGDHHIVKRRIRFAVERAPLIVRGVRMRIPALAREVETSAKRELVVENRDFLVMRTAGRMRVVELEMHSAMRLPSPAELDERGHFPIRRVDHRKIPVEDVDLKPAFAPDEMIQKIAEDLRRFTAVEAQAGAAVEIPSEQNNRTFGALRRAHESAEVVFAVDDERCPVGAHHAAAISAGLEKAGTGHAQRSQASRIARLTASGFSRGRKCPASGTTMRL